VAAVGMSGSIVLVVDDPVALAACLQDPTR
jgi:hypothetical protein